MFRSLLMGVGAVLDIIFNLATVIVIASVLIQWVGADPNNGIVRFIQNSTEPLFSRIRKFTGKIPGPFDWAPFVTLLIIVFLQVASRHFIHSFLF